MAKKIQKTTAFILIAGLHLSGFADDTELYLAPVLSSSAPNILFLLYSSGSMLDEDIPTQSPITNSNYRVDHLFDALILLSRQMSGDATVSIKHKNHQIKANQKIKA